MRTNLDGLKLDAWRHFITVHAQSIEHIDKALQEAGCIPLHWYDVLIELAEAEDKRLRLSELAVRVVLSRSGLTRMVDKLENAGLLRREAAAQDGRGSYAVLTESGAAALRKAWPVYASAIESQFAQHLSEEEARVLVNVFQRMQRTQ